MSSLPLSADDRDNRMCVCGHKSVSHGSFGPGREFVGVGLGPCGVDRDQRNAATGYLGDPCPCRGFIEATVEAPEFPAEGQTMTEHENAAERASALEPAEDEREELESIVQAEDERWDGARSSVVFSTQVADAILLALFERSD